MRPLKFSAEKLASHSNARFMFFDYETFVSPTGELVPNLAVVQYDDGTEFRFPADGVIGPDVTDELCQFLFRLEHKDFFVIAHNFQSFDGLFIQRWLLNANEAVDLIMNGSKIISLEVPRFHMTFCDSLAFVPTSLANFPALVGMTNVNKGDFPHRFTRPEHWNRIVPYPTKDDFDYNRKKESDQIVFDQWYDEDRSSKQGLYDFNKEFTSYCSQVNYNFGSIFLQFCKSDGFSGCCGSPEMLCKIPRALHGGQRRPLPIFIRTHTGQHVQRPVASPVLAH